MLKLKAPARLGRQRGAGALQFSFLHVFEFWLKKRKKGPLDIPSPLFFFYSIPLLAQLAVKLTPFPIFTVLVRARVND